MGAPLSPASTRRCIWPRTKAVTPCARRPEQLLPAPICDRGNGGCIVFSMAPVELNRILKAGIEAVKRGQKPKGRELLLKVVAADERNEDGWFWLSLAVDDPQDKITALENVDDQSANMTAQANLKWLKKARQRRRITDSRTRPRRPGSSRPPLRRRCRPSKTSAPLTILIVRILRRAAKGIGLSGMQTHLMTKRVGSKSLSYALRTAISRWAFN